MKGNNMSCKHCGGSIAYNVYTGRYFGIGTHSPIGSPCFKLGHSPR